MRSALVTSLVASAAGHGMLTSPSPREGTGGAPAPGAVAGIGIKLQPFSSARNTANEGCGGTANADLGFQQPTEAYQPGAGLAIQWELGVPHELDNLESGVRVSIHYADGDSFENNVLVGCMEGESGCSDESNGVYTNRVDASTLGRLVTLDATKTCNYCVVQWVWAAANDDGYYITCADISITTDGLLPDFDNLIPETDTNNNGLPDGTASTTDGSNPADDGGGGSSAAGAAVGVVIALLVVAAIGYYLYTKKGSMGGMKGPTLGGGGGGGGGRLPPDWTEANDPSSGRAYYVNAKTGETTWERPLAGPKAPVMAALPPPGPPGGGAMPPGWSAQVDPASGRTYYVNAVTGATSWEFPSQA